MLGNVLNGIQNWPSDADFFGPSEISTTVGPPETTIPTCKDKKKKKKCVKGKKRGKCNKKGFAKKCKKTCNKC